MQLVGLSKHPQQKRTVARNGIVESMYHGHPFDAFCTFRRNSSASGPTTSATSICCAQLNVCSYLASHQYAFVNDKRRRLCVTFLQQVYLGRGKPPTNPLLLSTLPIVTYEAA